MKNITLSFGKRIRSIRTSKKLSQEKLAELCALHPTYIGQIERGEKSPTLESINKLAAGLGVGIDKLFCNMDTVPESDGDDFAALLYNEALKLPEEKKKKLYKIVCGILEL